MRVCLLALWSDSLTYTMARALAFAGHTVTVWVADVERDRQSDWSLSRRIAAIPGVTVVADPTASPPDRIDQLIVQGHPQLRFHRNALDLLAPRASRLTAVSAGDRSRSLRQAIRIQWQEWRWYGRWFAKVKRIAYKDGHYPLDWLGVFRSRRVVGFDAHSKFLQDARLFDAIHASDWQSNTPRPLRANFLGSRDPAVRSRILDSVESYFVPSGPSSSPDAGSGQRMAWHAYSDAQPAALSPEDFLRVLSESDFTLSPPGYSLVTHRPVEALLRGSIPVLNADELDLYDLGLADGVNCIAVPPGGWPAAMDRVVRMSAAQITDMRRNIAAMLDTQVAYPALARNMSRRLGLDRPEIASTEPAP
jgi:hypothetical protein